MSFVRAGRPPQHSKGKRSVRPRRPAPRKEWVSTVSDLSVHKLSPAELSHRHEIHRSRNAAAAQWELKEKALKVRLAPLDEAGRSIVREVFSDRLLLEDVLSRSDRALAVVKDLFGDAPRRKTGHPSVTMAPKWESASTLSESPLSPVSQSLMNQQALNEVELSDEEYSDDEASPTGRTSAHVKSANLQKMKPLSRSRMKHRHKHYSVFNQTSRDKDPVTPQASGRAPQQSALNATAAVKGFQSRLRQSREDTEEPSVLVSQVLNPECPLSQSDATRSGACRTTRKSISQRSEVNGSCVAAFTGDHSSLGVLQAMLAQMKADLDSLGPDSEAASALGQPENEKQGLTGFSVALVSTLARLVHLFKRKEREAHAQARERERLEEELREQRRLIDALSAETMALREEVTLLQTRLQHQSADMEQKLDTVVLVMGELGLLEPHSEPHQGSASATVVHQSAAAAAVERDPPHQQAVSTPAVLLSPPQQRDSWQKIPKMVPVAQHRERSPNSSQPSSGTQACGSLSSLASLPLRSLPSASSLSVTSDLASSALSPDAMLAEIALLSRQNQLIKAQLSRAKELGSACERSPEGVDGQRRSSCSDTGRAMPQRVGEGEASDADRTGSMSQCVQATAAEQEARSPLLRGNSVEQRLLELNRQSAAARSRLLELIEQQKENISAKFSSGGSPIPPSAFSPEPAEREGNPEVSLLLPEKLVLLQTSDHDRRIPGSSYGQRGDRWDDKSQTEKRKEERWFSLSAHLRQ